MAKFDGLRRLADDWETEFARNKQLHGDKIHCRKGCSDCCHHLFQITEIEAAYISTGVKTLPNEKRQALQQRARNISQKESNSLRIMIFQMPGVVFPARIKARLPSSRRRRLSNF